MTLEKIQEFLYFLSHIRNLSYLSRVKNYNNYFIASEKEFCQFSVKFRPI